jgi:hypothetical protein
MPHVISVDGSAPDGTASHSIAKPALFRPKIAIDTREQSPLKFTRLEAVERALFTGDYSILGLEAEFAVCQFQPHPVRARIAQASGLPFSATPGCRHARGNRSPTLSFPDRAKSCPGDLGRF